MRPRMSSEPTSDPISDPNPVGLDENSEGQKSTDLEQTATASCDVDGATSTSDPPAEKEETVDRGESLITVNPAIGESSFSN